MITSHILDRDHEIIKFYNIDDETTKNNILKNKSMSMSTLSTFDDYQSHYLPLDTLVGIFNTDKPLKT